MKFVRDISYSAITSMSSSICYMPRRRRRAGEKKRKKRKKRKKKEKGGTIKMNAVCTNFDARSRSDESWNSAFLLGRTRAATTGDFGATISSGGPQGDVGDRVFWAWARDMRRGFASTGRNIALICARYGGCVSHRRGGDHFQAFFQLRRGDPDRILGPNKSCSSPRTGDALGLPYLAGHVSHRRRMLKTRENSYISFKSRRRGWFPMTARAAGCIAVASFDIFGKEFSIYLKINFNRA
ncbi:hypothetical protein PUN28_015626 [Cardiocondyla obscurior]|uniref:Uncharacterized protein n=1 Tax=Cardiocondyla obscurior TaxID=286306 RepID=A0AAW2EVS0_9HYME